MHRATPVMTSFRSYSSGGARTVITAIDDLKQMQEMAGHFMKGEQRDKVESPQNYGFTSVVMDATMGADGLISAAAEGFISFIGGNRSFPVCGIMDDRRHRLKGLEKGDVAMFRTVADALQLHLTADGGFWSAPTKKTVRLQLVDQQQQQQQSGGNTGPSLRDATGGAGSGASGASGASGGQQQKGQSPVYKDGQKSYRFVDVTENATRLSGNEAHMMLSDGDSYVHCTSAKTYLGGNAGKHQFAKVLTEEGASANVYARIGSLAGDPAIAPPASSDSRAAARVLPIVMLLLGVSLGANYKLATEAWPAVASACSVIASR